VGTGFLIASNLVLTVAHNIYQRSIKDDLPKETLEFFVGVSGDLPEKGQKVADYRYPQEFRKLAASDVTHDYALLYL
jgi:V8-like Glu-specific endopeptidase